MKRELRRRFNHDVDLVKTILRRWDPIGVFPDWNGGPALDEYDSYAPQLLSLLYSGASTEEIADRLENLRTGDMGMPPRRGRDEQVAEELVALALISRLNKPKKP